MKNLKTIILSFFILTIFSCSGVRSTSKSSFKNNEDSKIMEATLDTTKIEKEANKEENVKKATEVTETEEEITTTVKLTPINPNEPATIIDGAGNKTELNNTEQTTTTSKKKKDKAKKENLEITKKEESKETEDKGISSGTVAEIKKEGSGESRETWRLNFSLWWLLLLLIPVAVYFYYKKYGWTFPFFRSS